MMKNKKREDAKALISSVRNILFNDWDPLNVSGAMKTKDEYDYLIGKVIELLRQKPSLERIVEFLMEEEKGLGCIHDPKNTKNAASKLNLISDEM